MSIEDHAELVCKITDGMSNMFRRDISDIIEKHGIAVAASVATNLGIQMCSIGICSIPEETRDMIRAIVHEALDKNMSSCSAEFDAEIAIKKARGLLQ